MSKDTPMTTLPQTHTPPLSAILRVVYLTMVNLTMTMAWLTLIFVFIVSYIRIQLKDMNHAPTNVVSKEYQPIFNMVWNHSRNTFVFSQSFWVVRIIQTCSFIDFFNALLGVTSSSLAATGIMTVVKTALVWGLMTPLRSTEELMTSQMYVPLVFAWGITEATRYAFYMSKMLSMSGAPTWFKWIRYGSFYLVVPLISMLEWYMAYDLLPVVEKSRDQFNYYYLVGGLALYIPAMAYVFAYMHDNSNRHLFPKRKLTQKQRRARRQEVELIDLKED